MTLTAAGNPYTGNPTIEAGATVKAEPGVKFKLGSLVVKGTLKAEGTAEEPVVFTGANGKEPGEWRNIKFESGSGESVLDHVEVAYGGLSLNSGGVEITSSSPKITNSTFRKNKYSAIYAEHGGSPEIAHDLFVENGTPYGNVNPTIAYWSTASEPGEINIHDNTVEGGGSGFSISQSSKAGAGGTLGGNTVIGTNGAGLSYFGNDIPGNITENTLSGNKGSNLVSFSGTVAHSSTWNKGGGAVNATEVTVASGVTLTIAPGVVLIPLRSFMVKGTLKAEGTAEEPVVFTGAKAANPGEWRNIKFESGSDESVLDHVEIAYGGETANSGAVEITSPVSPTITHSTFRKNKYSAIKDEHGGSPAIGHDLFIENGTPYPSTASAIAYWSTTTEPGEINIHDNTVEGGGAGFSISQSSKAGAGGTLGGNTIIGTAGAGLSYFGNDIPGNITENTLSGNKGSNLISFSGTVAHSSTWNKGGGAVNATEVTVASGVTLTITPGVVLIPFRSFFIKGTLKAEGTAEEPVVFTGAKAVNPGEWRNIKFEAGSGESVLDHVEVAYGGSISGTGMIEVKGSHPAITNSTIRGAKYYGIMVTESGSPKIEWTRFRSNANGVYYSGTGKLSAPDNDWGCASGPKPAGCGDSVTAVDWKPAVQLPELAGHCRGKESQCGEGADPVSLATGQLDYTHRDLLLTNKSSTPLEFARAYTSGSSSDTGLGPGWSQTGLASAMELESGEVFVLRQDGRQDVFQKTESGYKAPSGVTDTLAKVEGVFQLTTLQNTVYRFDSSGRIASITDDHGLKTTYTYNAEGRLATITDPSAQTLAFTYNASNHITVVKDSTGREVKYAYSAAGDLETVTDALGGVTKYAYDASHRLTSLTDPRGNVILKNVYDSQGRIVEQLDGLEHLWKLEYKEGETIVTEPEGGEKTYGFDGQDRVVSETDQIGNTTTTSYDEAGNVDEIVKPGGAKWQFGHDGDGNLTSVIDPEEGERSYEYDGQNRLTGFTNARGNSWGYEWSEANNLKKITDPEEGETTLTYNESGQPLTITDANEHKTEFSYDARGNRLSVTDPLEHKTSFEYNSRNYLTSRTALGLKAEAFERNALGDLLARTTPLGNKTKYAYDANGLPTQITDPAENVWKIAYNAMGRPTTYTDPLEQQATVAYDGNLNPTKITDRRGKETTHAYDLANRLTEVQRPEGGDWSYSYDSRGSRTSVIDPRENETTYEYDLLDRMTKADEPLEVSSEYGYDANGNLTSVVDPRGNTTSYEYDKLDRPTAIDQPLEKTTSLSYDGASNLLARSTAAGTVEYGYDAADRLQEVSAGESTLRAFGYDAADRMTAATDAQGKEIEIAYDEDGKVASIDDGRSQSLTRSYNSRGYLTEQVDGRGTLEYGYDKLGRLTSLTDPQEKSSTFAYNAEGGLAEVKRPGGIVTTNIYDNAGRLAETTTEAGEPAAVLEALEYAYDPAGNVVKRIDARLEQETSFAYNALNRLTEFNPPGEGSTAYGYDAAGNRTEAGGTTYTYNALNQLTEASDGTTYGYDGAGRLASIAEGEEETTYEWDLFDHLATVESPGGTASYAYDALERLSERTSGSGTTVTHYGDLTDLPTYDANGEGETTTSYVQGPRGLLAQRSGGATSFPLRDAHGDITAIASEAGEVASRQAYDPWGAQLSGPTLEMGYLGAQQRRADPLTGLIQMGARPYSPSLGRFLTEDPVFGHLGLSTSFDRYAYAWDNPLNLYDLDGRDVCVPTPFGDACAEDATEDLGNAAGSAANAAGSAAEDAWNWTAPGRQWISDRSRDLVKQIDFSTNEFIAATASSLGTAGMCGIMAMGATAVGTPAAGAAAAGLCVTIEAVSTVETANDIFDHDNGLWTDELFE